MGRSEWSIHEPNTMSARGGKEERERVNNKKIRSTTNGGRGEPGARPNLLRKAALALTAANLALGPIRMPQADVELGAQKGQSLIMKRF